MIARSASPAFSQLREACRTLSFQSRSCPSIQSSSECWKRSRAKYQCLVARTTGFEPVTFEDVLNIVEREKPFGVIVQFGGQTPLNLARALEAAGVPIVGTSPDSIDRAEDRKRFRELVEAHHRRERPLGAYADDLGVTEARLRSACRAVAGTSSTGCTT